jgi:hypothetical protein
MSMDLPADWLDQYFPRKANVCVGKFPNDKVQSVCIYNQTKLDGAAATLDESGHLCTLANYRMGARDGWIRLWNENGQRFYFAEYKLGKKHGLICLFRDDMPWYVQQCDRGDFVMECLVTWKAGVSEALPEEKLTPEGVKELATARSKLSELEAQMDQGEAKLKKVVREWFLEADREIKRARAADRGVAARRDATNRVNERAKAQAAGMQELRRASLTGGR